MNFVRRWLAAVALIASGSTHAIHMSPNGTGQVLIYPYYTVQSAGNSPYNTYISIINHDGRGKALRVRFREGRNGREVLSFNLFLKPLDAWAGAVIPTAGGAALRTVDASCADPPFPVDFAPGSVPTREFSDAAYTEGNADAFGDDLARIREGYVEVLEMAMILDPAPDPATRCRDFIGELVAADLSPPAGALSGTLTVINVADGMDFTVNAVALSDVASQQYYRPANDPYPDFNASEINRASAFIQGGKLYRTEWTSGLAAIEAVLQRSAIGNEIVLDAATASSTDWVLTMPTWRFHRGPTAGGPFSDGLVSDTELGLFMAFAPRDGEGVQYVSACGFLCPGGLREQDMRAGFSSSVLSFHNDGTSGPTISGVLGSRNAWGIALPDGAQNGSAQVGVGGFFGHPEIRFSADTVRMDDGTPGVEVITVPGLPMLGFMVRTFRNGTLTCGTTACQGNYGGSFPHRSSRELQP